MQGLALGGEYGGAVIYVTEHVHRSKRGLSTSFIQMTGSLGLIVALVVIQAVQASTTQISFDTWAWRLPFLLSIILLAASVRIRQRMHESPVFKKMQEEKRLSTSPVRETFGTVANLKQLAVALFGLGSAMAVIVYNALFYPLFFLTQTLKLPSATANLLTMAATVLCIPLFCLAGWLSDRFGRKPVVLTGFVLAIATTFPIFHEIAHLANPALEAAQVSAPVSVQTVPGGCSFMFNPIGSRRFTSPCDVGRQILSAASVTYTTAEVPGATETVVHVGDRTIATAVDGFDQKQFTHDLGDALKQAGYGAAASPGGMQQIEIIGLLLLLLFCMTLGYGPVAVAMAEMFPARIRYTAMSFPYHFASGWIGGLLPTFSFAIAAAQGNIFAGLWYAVTWMIIGSVITLLFYSERRGADIE